LCADVRRHASAIGHNARRHEVTEFEGRAVLITGGALGIGRGIARAFAREGAAVAISDINAAAADALVSELSTAGSQAFAVIGDVSSQADAQRMVEAAVAGLGRLDVLVNNAGIQPIDTYSNVEDTPVEAWDRILGVNLRGTFLMSKYSLPHIRGSGPGGSVVNIASVQGVQSMPKVPAYAASKGGVLSLTRNMALDYAPQGIRVNAICPGTIDSEMVRTAARAEGGNLDQTLRRYGAVHPLGRMGLPEEVAEAALFLASERASFMTGGYLAVDGGLLALGAWAQGAGGGR
jgi:NAD(P)-dependent dehydrogenase (short-subunit alcohol dehydrogenase family)